MAEGEHQIGFEQLGVGSVLKHYHLYVPPNQREYSWTDKEVTKLFTDFAKAIGKGGLPYFLGTIVTIPRGPANLEVVDGQQRLATTAILLHAIRQYLLTHEPVMAESMTAFLSDYTPDRRSKAPRLKLNTADNELFRRLMEGTSLETKRPSHDRLKEAFELAEKHVKSIVSPHASKDHGDALNAWINFIEFNALAILLKVPNPSNAFKMFETLNDRGLRTSQSDLVKNYLFGESGDRISEALAKWDSMRSALSTLDAEEDQTLTFMRQTMICMQGHLIENEVFEKVQLIAKGADQAIQFATALDSMASDYVALFNPLSEKWNGFDPGVRRAVTTLNLLNVKPMFPLMLAIAAKFSPKDVLLSYRALISWSVRLMIASSTRSGSVEQPLNKNAHAVYTATIKDFASLRKTMADTIPNDPQFREAFKIAKVSQPRLARYYLESIEQSHNKLADPFYRVNDDQQAINLEHVMPQKDDKGYWKHIDPEMRQAYVTRFGNQALLLARANSDLKSAGFPEKKKVYAVTPYQTTRQIAEMADWGPTEIDKRQVVLADEAIKTWPL